jgi:bifunctional DNase/RNase
MIEMTIESVRINLATQQRVVILNAKETRRNGKHPANAASAASATHLGRMKGSKRHLFIWIAHAEAYSIAVHLQGTVSPRPLSHDLMKSLLESTGANIVRVEITDITDEIFYAHIVLDVAGKEVNVDARPSDAFALAIRADAPIYVAESVLEKAGVVVDEKDKDHKADQAHAPDSQDTQQAEKEMDAMTAQPSPLTQLAREHEALKEQLAQVRDELRQAQERIKEIEGK